MLSPQPVRLVYPVVRGQVQGGFGVGRRPAEFYEFSVGNRYPFGVDGDVAGLAEDGEPVDEPPRCSFLLHSVVPAQFQVVDIGSAGYIRLAGGAPQPQYLEDSPVYSRSDILLVEVVPAIVLYELFGGEEYVEQEPIYLVSGGYDIGDIPYVPSGDTHKDGLFKQGLIGYCNRSCYNRSCI